MPIRYDEVAVGQHMTGWTRKTDLMSWNRFAAVNDEFHMIHMDDDAGRAAGNPGGAFGMGNLRYAYLVNALRHWCGDEARLVELSCQYRAINQKGDELCVVGEIVEKAVVDGECRLRFRLDVTNQDGKSTCPGSAWVAWPR